MYIFYSASDDTPRTYTIVGMYNNRRQLIKAVNEYPDDELLYNVVKIELNKIVNFDFSGDLHDIYKLAQYIETMDIEFKT
jgi:hypothetical protein